MALRDLCEKYGIQFKKSLGQNLLLDDNINAIMVDAAGLTASDDVIEVGAGLGALTRRLCEQAGRVLAIEIDRSFIPCLEDQFGERENVRIFRGDVLNHDLGKLLEEFLPDAGECKMVSNLPYYITTPLLFHFWESQARFTRLVVMVQEEVAERMTAPPDSANYGVLSLATRLYCDADIVHRVPRTCFRPMPKVDSCVVRLRMRSAPLYPDVQPKFLMRLVRTAFQQRRKTLRNTLTRSGFGPPKDAVLAAFEETGIEPGRRPQTLTLDEFAALARAIRGRC